MSSVIWRGVRLSSNGMAATSPPALRISATDMRRCGRAGARPIMSARFKRLPDNGIDRAVLGGCKTPGQVFGFAGQINHSDSIPQKVARNHPPKAVELERARTCSALGTGGSSSSSSMRKLSRSDSRCLSGRRGGRIVWEQGSGSRNAVQVIKLRGFSPPLGMGQL
jgi:hypothetical protein